MLGLVHKSHTGSFLFSNILHFEFDPSLWDVDTSWELCFQASVGYILYTHEYTHSPSIYEPNKWTGSHV
jgi:hypothetical protein